MGETLLSKEALTRAALVLFEEGHVGPTGKGTWFIDNEAGSGFLGTIEGLDAARVSKPLNPPDPLTIASHVDHVRFALHLANRAARGENLYGSADWGKSWALRTVDEAAWKALVAELRAEVAAFREVLSGGEAWSDEEFGTGALGLLCHTAWHLGAVRQALGLVKAPSKEA
jgi:hypothetical protein